MQATNSIKAGIKLAVVVIAMMTAFVTARVDVSARSPMQTPNFLGGITLDSSLSQQDIAYLESSLQVVYNQAPDWLLYIEQAKPFVLRVDLHQGELGHAAITSCCDVQGRGTVVFGNHFGYSWNQDPAEARQVTFIGTLVHEVTHLREQRAGRIAVKADFKSCVAAEKPGLEKQLEVKRALFAENPDAAFRKALQLQIRAETRDVKSRALWDFYCGAFK